MVRVRQLPLRSGRLDATDYPSGKFYSILLFYTICDFCSQSRPNAAKAEMNKTIVKIERISDCFPKLNIAKSGFYNFESDAFNHSATLPTVATSTMNLFPKSESGAHFRKRLTCLNMLAVGIALAKSKWTAKKIEAPANHRLARSQI